MSCRELPCRGFRRLASFLPKEERGATLRAKPATLALRAGFSASAIVHEEPTVHRANHIFKALHIPARMGLLSTTTACPSSWRLCQPAHHLNGVVEFEAEHSILFARLPRAPVGSDPPRSGPDNGQKPLSFGPEAGAERSWRRKWLATHVRRCTRLPSLHRRLVSGEDDQQDARLTPSTKLCLLTKKSTELACVESARRGTIA